MAVRIDYFVKGSDPVTIPFNLFLKRTEKTQDHGNCKSNDFVISHLRSFDARAIMFRVKHRFNAIESLLSFLWFKAVRKMVPKRVYCEEQFPNRVVVLVE